MLNKKKSLILGSALALALGGAAVGISVGSSKAEKIVAADETTTFTISKGYLGTIDESGSGSSTVLNSGNYGVLFEYTGASGGSDDLVTLADGGYLRNVYRITSINNVTVTFSSTDGGTLKAVRGWYSYPYDKTGEGEAVGSSSITWQDDSLGVELTSGTAYDFSGISPNYIKFLASGGSVSIESIVYDYDCWTTTSSMTGSLRVETAGAPTYGGAALTDDQYVWLNVNFGSISWQTLVMTEDTDGSWYIDLTSTTWEWKVNTNILSYKFVLGTATAADWDKPATGMSDAWGAALTQGQTTFTADTPTFEGEGSYTVNFTLNATFEGGTFGTPQLMYSDATFNAVSSWPGASEFTSTSTTTTSFTGTLSRTTNGTIYFAVYVWFSKNASGGTSGYDGVAASDTGGTAYALTVTGDTDVSITCAFEGTATGSRGDGKAEVVTMTVSTGGGTATSVSVADLSTYVYDGDNQEGVTPSITWGEDGGSESYSLSVTDSSLDNVNIRIEDTKIVGLKGGTTTEVKLTTKSGLTDTFNVTVASHAYSQNYSTAWSSADFEDTEDWFDTAGSISSSSITEITGMSSTFANGMDISSAKALYENGAHYFTSAGVEQSLFYLLKDAGVNWIRLRLWVRPSETYTDSSGSTVTYDYGGGSCDLDRVTWMAHEAVSAGMDVLLDFHYSDYWTHPGQQVLPKDWSGLTSTSDIATQLRTYTKETLVHLYNNDAMPTMVQLGNEITSGMMVKVNTSYDTSSTAVAQAGNPLYISNASTSSYSNTVTYVQAASNGVDDAITEIGTENLNSVIGSTDIKKMIHYTSTLNSTTYTDRFGLDDNINRAKSFFNQFSSIDYDVIGLSAYPFYDFQTDFSALSTGLSSLSSYYSTKEIMIAETSSPFTSNGWNDYTSNSTSSTCSSYDVSVLGQAKIIRDITNAVASLDNGTGVFYWESAWLPIGSTTGTGDSAVKTCYVGWGDAGSNASWANQALFSFGGKALGSLQVYNLMNPNVA